VDLLLYGRVLWRFRLLVFLGLVLAILLAILAMAKIEFNGGSPSLSYRQKEVWQSQTTLQITGVGFPEGRAVFPSVPQGAVWPFADPGRLQSLGDIYSQIANSDEVRAAIQQKAPAGSSVAARPIPPSVQGGLSPFIGLLGNASTPAQAVKTAEIGTRVFLDYLRKQQAAANIPERQRVDLKIITNAAPPILIQPRKKTLAIVVFLAVLTATIALAFVLENIRPQPRALQPIPGEGVHVSDARRSA
jgi:hypothetical protein